MKTYPSIESLRHVIQSVNKYCSETGTPKPTIKFKGTVKLHGTNGSVSINEAGEVKAFGRSRELSITSDNFGFAGFVSRSKFFFNELFWRLHSGSGELILFGEWCGQGIQKGVAVSTLPKMFVIFGVYHVESDFWLPFPYIREDIIRTFNENQIYFINQAPTYEIEIDFNDPSTAADRITELTLAVEENCPWGKLFNVDGVGEGIVWFSYEYPVTLSFKSKGLKHKKSGPKGARVETDPAMLSSIDACVEQVLPEWRLEQGISHLKENGFTIEPSSTGEYLKWISKDILKEEYDVIEANGLEWGVLNKAVQRKAREFFLTYNYDS